MNQTDDLAVKVIRLAGLHNISGTNQARLAVKAAAQAGRAYILPAGARNNPTARILIDGIDVGEAAVLGHNVREDLSAHTGPYSTRKLLPDNRP